MKKIVVLLLILFSILFAGCDGVEPKVEVQTYESVAGYTIDLPTEWVRESDSWDNADYANEDKSIVLTVDHAMGAMEYASLREIGEALQSSIADQVYEYIESYYDDETKTGFRFVVGGTDFSGNPLTTEVYIFAPYPAIRYYFVFTAESGVYAENSAVIDSVIHSVDMPMSDDEVYHMIQQHREEELASELEKLTKEQSLEE